MSAEDGMTVVPDPLVLLGGLDLEARREFIAAASGVIDKAAGSTVGRTANQLRVERTRLKDKLQPRYRRYLREEIGDTVANERDVDDEIRLLFDALS